MQAAHPVDQVGIAEPHRSAVLAELQRIVSSAAFRGSKRCCRFLEYCVHHVLDGAPLELRERNIGIEVFQRPPDYDTAEDAIVRVTANEVRKRLAQYYQELDREADPSIGLPPGSYAVTFRWRVVLDEPAQSIEAPGPRLSGYRIAMVACVVAPFLGVLAYVGLPWRANIKPDPARAEMRTAIDDPVWSLFRSGQSLSAKPDPPQ